MSGLPTGMLKSQTVLKSCFVYNYKKSELMLMRRTTASV